MKLKEICDIITDTAMSVPSVNYAYEGDVFQLNGIKDAKFSAFVATQGTHSISAYNISYGFYFFYIDRLTADGGNRLDIQSAGIDGIRNICQRLEEGYGLSVENIQFQPFTQRFEQECAGVYANVTINAPLDACYDDYGD